MNRLRTSIATLLLTATTLVCAQQPYPSQPVTLVVPFAAGSGTDAVARVIAARLSERLGQQVIVDNRAGANGQIAATFVAKSKPDGHTLYMATNTSHSANPSLYKKLSYDPIKDFTPITLTGELPFVLTVANALPVKTLKELIAYAKAHPGKLSYGTPNSTSLVTSETVKRLADINVVGVPYKASPQVLTDMIGGSIDMYVVDLGSGQGMIREGRIRAIAITTKTPSKILPDVQPIAATLPGFDVTSWNGIFGPANLPRPVVERLNKEILAALAMKDTRDRLAQLGFEVGPSSSPEAFGKYVAEQLAHWTTLIRQAGIEAE